MYSLYTSSPIPQLHTQNFRMEEATEVVQLLEETEEGPVETESEKANLNQSKNGI